MLQAGGRRIAVVVDPSQGVEDVEEGGRQPPMMVQEEGGMLQ
jgi:hypothetical protein